MEKYESYIVDDFLKDDLFIDWVLMPTEASDNYWRDVFTQFPSVQPKAEEARRILSNIRIKPGAPMPGQMRMDILDQILITKSATKKKHIISAKQLFLWSAAASVLIIFLWFVQRNQLEPEQTHLPKDLAYVKPTTQNPLQQIINTSSTPLVVLLPDNSTVILNPNSNVAYNTATFDKNREINLQGEAFFEVEKQENDAPFIVKTNHLVTKVLGTSFRIQAFDDQKEHRVTVNTGLVVVRKAKEQHINGRRDKADNAVYVSANQEAIYKIDRATLSLEDMDEIASLSKEAVVTLFDFKSTPLETVLATLSEKYNVVITLDDPVLAKRTITASLSSLHLNEKLDLISKAAEAEYHIEDGKIILTPLVDNQ